MATRKLTLAQCKKLVNVRLKTWNAGHIWILFAQLRAMQTTL